ncbi:MAG: hypothetical protein AABW81_00440, partial [Nanoarchaeota archaeon]
KESKIIENIKKGKIITPDFSGPSAIILDKSGEKTIDKVNKLIEAYSKKGSLEDREEFDEWRL